MTVEDCQKTSYSEDMKELKRRLKIHTTAHQDAKK